MTLTAGESGSVEAAPIPRKKNGQFVKGVSGNPGGKPTSVYQFMDLCRSYGDKAFEKLIEWVESDNPQASIPAIKTVLAYAYGNPTDKIDVNVNNTKTSYVIMLNSLNAAESDTKTIEVDASQWAAQSKKLIK